jgi:amino acid adenylation domain-containing protein
MIDIDASIGDAWAQILRANPDGAALRFDGATTTYRQLDELAAGIRSALPPPMGEVPVVAVVADRSVEFVAAVLGAVTAGFAYLPLDADLPDPYLRQVLAEARPQLLIAGRDRARRLDPQLPVLAVEDVPTLATAASDAEAAGPQDAAYVIYTSGSTGRPKGVVVSHRALLNSTLARYDAYGAAGRVPLVHSVGFDLASGVLWWALLSGGTLVISPTGLRDVAGTLRLIRDEDVTHLVYLASVYPALLDRAAADPPRGLRAVMIGSEPWNESLIDRHAAIVAWASLFNEYGPTEATVWSSYARVYDSETGHRAPLTLGEPITNTGWQVRDSDGRPVSGSGLGELYLTGANLATGYLHRPDLTGQRFVELDPGVRAYRTGDLVRVTEDGGYVFVGRADRQLKVGGNRVEAGQVEAALMAHPAIRQAHVTVPGEGGGLVAYLLPYEGRPVDTADVAARVAGELPGYMLPAAYLVLHEFPRTANGKIDQARLPLLGQETQQATGAATPLEEELLAAVGHILGRAGVPVTVPLTELGANSLVFVRIAALLAGTHGVEVPVSALFDRPTVRAIAHRVITSVPGGRAAVTARPLPPEGCGLSAQQRQIWVLHHLAPHPQAYQTQWSLRLFGPLRVPLLEAALSLIVARHEILRTTFHDGPDGPVQVVHDPWPVRIQMVDLTHLPEAHRSAAVTAEIDRGGRHRIDVGLLPLVRWHLYRLGPEQWRLLQVEHHLIHDGWSAVLFLREIRDAYQALTTHQTPRLPELPVQYRDWVAWQREWTTTTGYAEQARYWTSALTGAPAEPVTFEPDHPRPARQEFTGGCLRAVIPAATMTRVDARCDEYQVSRFAVFLTAFAVLAWRHTAAEDLVIGSALSNRRQPETLDLIGMFVNALPLRLRLDPGRPVSALVADTMRTLLAAQDHQEFPFIEIVNRLRLPRDAARNPLFSLMFAFHDSPQPDADLGNLHSELIIEHNGTAKNDLNVICVPQPPDRGGQAGGVQVLWEYDTSLYTRNTAAGLLDGFRYVLDTLLGAWQRPIADVEWLDSAVQSAVLRAGTGPTLPTVHRNLHGSVDVQIARQPQCIAVVHHGRPVTYRALDRLTATIEANLADHHVGVGSVVAVAGPACPELLAACLAVLRRGGAYLWLDDQQPATRLDALIADAAPAAVVCLATTRPALRRWGLPVLPADIDLTAPGACRPAPPRPAAGGEMPAYLVYTSGSTGSPKAVVATHANAVNAISARTAVAGDLVPCTLVSLPPFFDVAAGAMWWTLSRGGTIVLPDTLADAADPDTTRMVIDKHTVTHLNLIATYYRHLLLDAPPGWGASLRVVAIGGEPCPPDLPAAHADQLPDAVLLNEYGPTETTVLCSTARLYDPCTGIARRVTVGHPAPGYQLAVLDTAQRLAPLGARGELYIGGSGVAAGYHRQPDLTRERFLTVAGGPLAGVRLFRTGDQARLNHDGQFEILGRLDDQVKIRGHRVELGEVRHCLAAHPDVADAAVTHDPIEGRLVAYAEPRQPGAVTAATLRRWTAERLPTFMTPSQYVIVAHLPRTPTGKIDLPRLPQPDSHPITSPDSDPADGDVSGREQRLRALVGDLLGAPVGLDDDFFAHGGDSMQAIRLAQQAREHGIDLSVSQIMQGRTVRAMALLTATATAPTSAAPVRPSGTPVALTPIQAWFFAQPWTNPHHFNQARLYEIRPNTPTGDLRQAIMSTLARHDAFRTRFRRDQDTWSAHLGPVTIEAVEDLPLPADAPEQHLADELDRLHRSLHLINGPLWRAAIATTDRGERRWLALVTHHLLVDAISWDLIVADITTACRQLSDGQPLPDRHAPGLPSRPTSPATTPADIDHWTRLTRQPKPTLTIRPAPAAPYGRLRHLTRTLTADASRYLTRDVPRLYGASTESVLLAAVVKAIAPLTDRPGLYAFLEGHGRDADTAGVVGWLTHLHPVLLTPPDSGRLIDWAAAFTGQLAQHASAASGYGHARYRRPSSPLGALLRTMAGPQVTINYLGQPPSVPGDAVLRPAPLPAGQTIADTNVLPTPLHITFTGGTDLQMRVSHDPGQLSAAAIDEMCDRFTATLEQAARVVALTDARLTPDAGPHFLVHPVGGGIDCYLPLARALAPDHACYGLPHDPDDNPSDLADLANRYVARIQAVQPTGPYTLTGWSFGAVIAYEMARHLDRHGHPVRLTLLDPPSPDHHGTSGSVLTRHLARLLPQHPVENIAAAAAETRHLPPDGRTAALHERLTDLDNPEQDPLRQRISIVLRHHNLLATWRPTGAVHHLHLIIPSDTLAGERPNLTGWRRLSRTPTTVDVIPNDHDSILTEPGLTQIANLLHGTGTAPPTGRE